MKLSYNDSNHSYFLDGKRCKSVSAVASWPDDKYALDQWRKRQVVLGMALAPQLLERAAAHHDDKKQLDGIAEEAMTAAKSHDAAGRGTAVHRLTERIDLGEMIVDSPLARAVQAAWQKALDNAGLEIIPSYIERIVVFPEQRIAGRFDRIVRRKFDGALAILDVKTGASAIRYPHSTCVQLACYANAPLLAGAIPSEGGSTEEFLAMPALNKRVGYVAHMPDETTVEVKSIDIEAGWAAAEKIVFPTLEWRARRDLVHDIEAVTVSGLTDNLRARLGILKLVDGAREHVAARWPAGVPFKPPWDEAQGKAVATVIEHAERDLGVPF